MHDDLNSNAEQQSVEAFQGNPQGEMEVLTEEYAVVIRAVHAGNREPDLLNYLDNLEVRMNLLVHEINNQYISDANSDDR